MNKMILLFFLIFSIMVFSIEVTEEYKDELFYDLIYNNYEEQEVTRLIDKYNYTFKKRGKYSENLDDLIIAAITNEKKDYSLDFIKKLNSIYKEGWNNRYKDINGENINSPYKYALEYYRFDIFDYLISKSYKIPNYKESILKSDVFKGIVDSIDKGNSIEVINYLEKKGLWVDFNFYEKDVYKYLASLDLKTFQNLHKISNIDDFLKKENSYEKILLSFSNDIDMEIQSEYIDFLISKIDIGTISSGFNDFEKVRGIQAEIFFYLYKKGIEPDIKYIDNYFSHLYDYSTLRDSFELYLIYYTKDKLNNTEERFDQNDLLNHIFTNYFENFVYVMNRDEILKAMEIVFVFDSKRDKDFYFSRINNLIENEYFLFARKYLLKGISENFWTIEDIALYYDFRGIEEQFSAFFLVNDIDLTFKTKYKTMDRNIDLMEYFVEKNLFYEDFLEKYDGDFNNLFFSALKYSSLDTIEYITYNFKDKIPSDRSSVLNYFMAAAQSHDPEKFYFVKSFFNVKELDSWAIEKLIQYNWDLEFVKKIMNDSKIDFSEKTYTYLSLAASFFSDPEIFNFFETKGIILDKEKKYSFGDPIFISILENPSFSMKKHLIDYYGVNYSHSEGYSLLSSINPDYYKTIKYIYEHEDFKYKDLPYYEHYDLIDKEIFDNLDIEARFIVESKNILVIDYFLNQIQRINMFSERWRSLLDFAVINDNFFSQKYILLNNYDVDYGIRGIGSSELRIGDMELNNVFHFLARSSSYNYFNSYFYKMITDDEIQHLMSIQNSEGIIPLMYFLKLNDFNDINSTLFFLRYKGFDILDSKNNNLLHYYAMNENIFVEFKENVSKENITLELFNLKNEDGLTPYELALEMGNVEKAKHIKDLQDYYK
ncbi:hypothetical protein [Geotoga petraea]|uniref:Ankyrin repeat-containing protein n=1 Tax=Geotoga petraea TaxID=28234 RepID=A0A4Z0W297_9BACT|nr:hypothetical protein [Geotoga petraea]TGG88679.1 hypothetical protein E4650_00285 [Geotoga petraea]